MALLIQRRSIMIICSHSLLLYLLVNKFKRLLYIIEYLLKLHWIFFQRHISFFSLSMVKAWRKNGLPVVLYESCFWHSLLYFFQVCCILKSRVFYNFLSRFIYCAYNYIQCKHSTKFVNKLGAPSNII